MKFSELKKTAKDLNELLFDSENKKKGWIDTKLAQPKLEKEIIKAAKLLNDEADERDVLSEVSQKVLEELCPIKSDEEKPEEGKGNPELSLEEQTEEGHIEDLKKLVKAEEVFKLLRKGIGIQKDAEKLRPKMLAILNPEEKEEAADLTTGKKEEKKKDKKKDKEEKTTKKDKVSTKYGEKTEFGPYEKSHAGMISLMFINAPNKKITLEKITTKLELPSGRVRTIMAHLIKERNINITVTKGDSNEKITYVYTVN